MLILYSRSLSGKRTQDNCLEGLSTFAIYWLDYLSHFNTFSRFLVLLLHDFKVKVLNRNFTSEYHGTHPNNKI